MNAILQEVKQFLNIAARYRNYQRMTNADKVKYKCKFCDGFSLGDD